MSGSSIEACGIQLRFERNKHLIQHLLGIAEQHAIVLFPAGR